MPYVIIPHIGFQSNLGTIVTQCKIVIILSVWTMIIMGREKSKHNPQSSWPMRLQAIFFAFFRVFAAVAAAPRTRVTRRCEAPGGARCDAPRGRRRRRSALAQPAADFKVRGLPGRFTCTAVNHLFSAAKRRHGCHGKCGTS